MSNKLTLEQCTKAELIEIIRCNIIEYRIGHALIHVAAERENKKLEEADVLLEKASEELNAYIEIANKANEDPRSITPAEYRRAFEHYKNYTDLIEQRNKIIEKKARL